MNHDVQGLSGRWCDMSPCASMGRSVSCICMEVGNMSVGVASLQPIATSMM